MARKVIIDCDPGIDDAVALTWALFDPRLEVVAITGVAGNVSAEQASRNIQLIVEQLDPPRAPRLGAAVDLEDAPAIDSARMHGHDGLGDLVVNVSRRFQQHPSDKLICDEVHAAPDEITIVCLGPLTNVARALKRDPDVCSLVSRIVMAGGSVIAGGNITPAAELNIYADPTSARTVFRSPTTKTLVPLDATREVAVTYDVIDQLPGEESRAGKLCRVLLPFAFRACHQFLGRESLHLHGVVALMSVLQPELFETEYLAGDVETRGDLTRGATVFDRRAKPFWLSNMEVAMSIDGAAALDCLVRGLAHAGRQSQS